MDTRLADITVGQLITRLADITVGQLIEFAAIAFGILFALALLVGWINNAGDALQNNEAPDYRKEYERNRQLKAARRRQLFGEFREIIKRLIGR